ncbi:hypothetical protein VaNZ11_012762 [Volvox africanus]|uniref:Uncharacterized protein n=1 Tax=Volvox africanus TaxID=51714 RepID=A0ABQ5SG47_9CHLO|nr:hypothetical protein VaNZ11_012762 [Volvox africanus]
MDLGFAYKIMRARAPVGYPPAMTTSPGEPAAPAPTTSIPGAAVEQSSEPQTPTSRPRRSLSAVALTWAPVLVEERSLEVLRKPSAVDSSGAPAASGSTAAAAEAPSPAPTSSPPAILGPLHLVPRPLVPSARGVTIGPFAEALAAVAARPPRRRPGADASALRLLVGGGSSSSPASPAVSPQPPLSLSPASPPISPPLRNRAFINPNYQHQQHHNHQQQQQQYQQQVQGAVQGASAQSNTTAAAPAPGGSKRARRGVVQQQQHQQQQLQHHQQQQLLLLPRVASQKAVHLRQQQQGSHSPTAAAAVVTGAAALSITSLMPSPSAPALSLAMAPALEVEASGQGVHPSTSPVSKESSTAWGPRCARNTTTGALQGLVAAGPITTIGHAVSTRPAAAGDAVEAAVTLPPTAGAQGSEEWECRLGVPSAESPGLISGEADSGGGGAAAVAVAREVEAGRHGEPSHGATDDGTGGHSHHDGVTASGGGAGGNGGVNGCTREAATVQLPTLPMLAMGQSYMGYQGSGSAVSRGRTPRQISSVSATSASQGGQTHGAHRQQAALQGSGSWRQMMAAEDAAGMLWVAAGAGGGAGGGHLVIDPEAEADAAELDRLEQWVAASQRNPAMVEVAIEQRRALKRLEQLRSRLLRGRGASSTDGICESDGPEPGSGTTHSGSGSSMIPSWVADAALTGRIGSDSLVALASQVSRLPHIDYDQMRDPQYRMKLKARSKQGRLAVLNPVINDELEDMPIRGRRRPWKPLHI